jgi:hypothetical protein
LEESFKWFSPLGISVALFLAIGTLWILIGALTVPLLGKGIGPEIIFVSNSTDEAYFGRSPSELLASDPALSKLRTLLLTVIAGLLLLAGILFLSVGWFGLRQGQTWALIALSVAGILALGFWVLSLLPYARSGITLRIGDLPPFMWIPALLILPAIILGWIGLR